jgi:hypothetical protein
LELANSRSQPRYSGLPTCFRLPMAIPLIAAQSLRRVGMRSRLPGTMVMWLSYTTGTCAKLSDHPQGRPRLWRVLNEDRPPRLKCEHTFPQHSPSSLLTTAACGGLRSTPDCYAAPCGPALLVTQDPKSEIRELVSRRVLCQHLATRSRRMLLKGDEFRSTVAAERAVANSDRKGQRAITRPY